MPVFRFLQSSILSDVRFGAINPLQKISSNYLKIINIFYLEGTIFDTNYYL